ncbi:MAG: hypothetical protein LBU19_07340, partial [Treponema sp.]|nr:hypothetical protein [Treponema sp.]
HCEARSAEAIVQACGLLTEFAASRWLAYRKLLPTRQHSFALDCFGATLRVVLAMTDASFS